MKDNLQFEKMYSLLYVMNRIAILREWDAAEYFLN